MGAHEPDEAESDARRFDVLVGQAHGARADSHAEPVAPQILVPPMMLRRMLSVLAAASQPQRVESNRCGASGHAQGPVLTTQGRGASDLRLHLCSECADVALCADSGRLSRTASGKSVAERPGRDGTLARPAVAAASATCCVCVCVRLHKRGGGRSKISAMGASRPLFSSSLVSARPDPAAAAQ